MHCLNVYTGFELDNNILECNTFQFDTIYPILSYYTSSYPRSPNLCSGTVVDCVGKPWIFIQ